LELLLRILSYAGGHGGSWRRKVANMIELKSRLNLSHHLYQEACTITKDLLNAAPTDQIATVAAVIILAHTSLEAYLNEFLNLKLSLSRAKKYAVLRELIRARLRFREKWVVVMTVLSGGSFDKGKEPFQSLILLTDLRNEIVHYSPEFLPIDKLPGKRIPEIAKMMPHPFRKGSYSWPGRILIPECARWACKTAHNNARMLYEAVDKKDRTLCLGSPWEPPPT
jgi:hypothetical protein